MPDNGYEGMVVFRGLVRRGDRKEWENVKQVQVEVEAVEMLKNEVKMSEKTTATDTTDRTYYPDTVTTEAVTDVDKIGSDAADNILDLEEAIQEKIPLAPMGVLAPGSAYA
jgi:phage tail tube protein FII